MINCYIIEEVIIMRKIIFSVLITISIFLVGCKEPYIEPPHGHPSLEESLTIEVNNNKLIFSIIAITPEGCISSSEIEKEDFVNQFIDNNDVLNVCFQVLNGKEISENEDINIDSYLYFTHPYVSWLYSFGFDEDLNIVRIMKNNEVMGYVKLDSDGINKILESVEKNLIK